MNLPDRLGESDTDAILRSGRAYGVAAAIAVGVVAYMSGGVSGVEMGGATAATAPPAVPFYLQTGPNLPAGMDLWYALDPTQSDQSVLNTQEQVNGISYFRGWTVAGADSGAFFNQAAGDTTVVDFVWASGDKEYIASSELAVDTMCSSYARTTVRYDADWQWSGGTIKNLWWQSSPMNAATGFYNSGRPSLINATWSNTSPTTVVAGEWADVETYYKYMGTDSSELKIWLDGALVVDSVGFSYANGTPATRLAMKPWHGGAGLKTQVDTISYSRSVVYGTAGPCVAPSAAWFQEDWNYTSTANLHSDPNGWLTHTNAGTITDSVVLVTGVSTPSGQTKAISDTLKAGEDNGNEAAVVGYDLAMPETGKTEIWVEVEWRTSSNWATNQSGVGNPDHKTVLVYDDGSSERWSIKIGPTAGSGIACYNATNGKQDGTLVGPNLDAPTDAWDGAWHTIRAHFKMASDNAITADGAVECWFDGVLYNQDLTYTSAQSGSKYFNKVSLGRTFNQAIAVGSIDHQYGRVVVYDTDPGWS